MKTTKIYDNEKEVYSGKCYVNTVIFRGRIYDEFKKVGQDGIKFSLQLSNGKDPKTGEWNKPTFADCTAFGVIAKRRVPPWDKSRWRFFKFRVGVTRRWQVL